MRWALYLRILKIRFILESIIRFRLTEDSLLYYTYFALKSKKNKFAQYSDGTTLKNINQKMLKKINVIIPEKKVLEKFEQIVQPILIKLL